MNWTIEESLHELSKKHHSRHHTVKLPRKPKHKRFKRSKSLNALNLMNFDAIQPRMQKLESLEATMTNIALALSHCDKTSSRSSSIQGDRAGIASDHQIEHYSHIRPDYRCHRLTKALKEQRETSRLKDITINQLKNECEKLKEVLKLSSSHGDILGHLESNSSDNAVRLSLAIEEKKAVVKSLKLSLESCEISENIDKQIARAEIEYRLGTEELVLMDLQQKYLNEINEKTNLIQEKDAVTKPSKCGLYKYVTSEKLKSNSVCLHAIELPSTKPNQKFSDHEYIRRCLGFDVRKEKDENELMVIDYIDSSSVRTPDLKKGDRLIEINGNSMVDATEKEYLEALSSSNSSIRMLVSRQQNKAKKLRDVEVSKEEMSSLVHKLDHRIKENKEIYMKYEKLVRDKSNLEKTTQKQRRRINYLEDRLDQMIAGWNDLRLALDEQLTKSDWSQQTNWPHGGSDGSNSKDGGEDEYYNDNEIDVLLNGSKDKLEPSSAHQIFISQTHPDKYC